MFRNILLIFGPFGFLDAPMAWLFPGLQQPTYQDIEQVANAVIFGLYHVHKPWSLPSIIISNLTYSSASGTFSQQLDVDHRARFGRAPNFDNATACHPGKDTLENEMDAE